MNQKPEADDGEEATIAMNTQSDIAPKPAPEEDAADSTTTTVAELPPPAPLRVAITHTIEQRFDRVVRMSTHWLRLRPSPHSPANVTAYSLGVSADPHFINWLRDPFENHMARLDLPDALASLTLTIDYLAELRPKNPFDFLTEPYAFEHPFDYPEQLEKELAHCLRVDAPGPRMKRALEELGHGKVSSIERLSKAMQFVTDNHVLLPEGQRRADTPERVLAAGRGNCWDLSWLLTIILRHLGFASQMVCGHKLLLADPDDAKGIDVVSMHCWTVAFLPGAGWIGLDPCFGLFTDEHYIPFAFAPDALRVAPLVGFREACDEQHTERLHVRRLVPTTAERPDADTEWSDVRAVGRFIERDLEEAGLNASMGLSLSLVSHAHRFDSEWNVFALGPSKRHAAEWLLSNLREQLAPGGVVQVGQSEWFAGDALPRWRLGCYFRADGKPIWGASTCPGLSHPTPSLGSDDAGRFLALLAESLDVDGSFALPAVEDPLLRLLSGSDAIPLPDAADLADPARRRALAQHLSQTATAAVGYALPLAWDHARGGFRTGTWTFRRERLYLMPGDSSMGYRLPLSSLVHDRRAQLEGQLERSPFEPRAPLPDPGPPTRPSVPAREDSPPRTAVCAQVRDGQLYLFVPPLSHLEHYLELMAGVKAAAEASGLVPIIEGYEPPEDPRLRRLVLDPDAGVLRVHLPITDSWDERVRLLETVYDAAWNVGLLAERITDDGRRMPVGGGSRITIGGSQPSQSPFLQRPGILRDLVACFQRHPSLSYFFAGRAIGASGFAPRPDEGRDEAVYELSIALSQLSDADGARPWQADRALRHLLTDPAGDLKRAEIHMGDLYSPDRDGARLGRLHVGAFETAPDARTAALQSLLLLGLIGRYARMPDGGSLVRHGPALHDRYLLPDVLWNDLRSVIADLNRAGYPFQLSWFAPLKELRFPHIGSVLIGEIALELRTAHEPWPLLSEQASAAGMARFIDMANERLQVRLSGLAPGRYTLSCNGHRVPLHSTGTHGEYLAGVRYKVNNPPATMHPTIPPIDALVFDLIDSWSGRAIGGCTYRPPRLQYWGPVGTPLAFPEPPPPGMRERKPLPPPVPLPPLPGRVERLGGFFPWGSGLGPMAAPVAGEPDRYANLLDLIQRY